MTPAQDMPKLKEVLLYVLRATADKPNVGETVLHKLLYFMDKEIIKEKTPRDRTSILTN